MNTPRHSFPPNMPADDGVYPFPLASDNLVRPKCRYCGQVVTCTPVTGVCFDCVFKRRAEASAIEQRLREPRSGARHVRLTDSVQVGENEFEEPHNIRADLVALAAGVVSALILVVVVVL
jgi:hypothetical protein